MSLNANMRAISICKGGPRPAMSLGNRTMSGKPNPCRDLPRLVPGQTQPIVAGQHAHGGVYRATIELRAAGKVTHGPKG